MQQSIALLDDDLNVGSRFQAHDSEVELQIDGSEGFTEEQLWECLKEDPLPIMTGWPKRRLAEHPWLPSTQDRSATISDIYAHLKPKKIGHVSVHGFVKVNELWVLHGRVQYVGGHLLNHSALKPFRLTVHLKDIDPLDASLGRTLVNIVKVRTDPLE
jgi:hypothetical protein